MINDSFWNSIKLKIKQGYAWTGKTQKSIDLKDVFQNFLDDLERNNTFKNVKYVYVQNFYTETFQFIFFLEDKIIIIEEPEKNMFSTRQASYSGIGKIIFNKDRKYKENGNYTDVELNIEFLDSNKNIKLTNSIDEELCTDNFKETLYCEMENIYNFLHSRVIF